MIWTPGFFHHWRFTNPKPTWLAQDVVESSKPTWLAQDVVESPNPLKYIKVVIICQESATTTTTKKKDWALSSPDPGMTFMSLQKLEKISLSWWLFGHDDSWWIFTSYIYIYVCTCIKKICVYKYMLLHTFGLFIGKTCFFLNVSKMLNGKT